VSGFYAARFAHRSVNSTYHQQSVRKRQIADGPWAVTPVKTGAQLCRMVTIALTLFPIAELLEALAFLFRQT